MQPSILPKWQLPMQPPSTKMSPSKAIFLCILALLLSRETKTMLMSVRPWWMFQTKTLMWSKKKSPMTKTVIARAHWKKKPSMRQATGMVATLKPCLSNVTRPTRLRVWWLRVVGWIWPIQHLAMTQQVLVILLIWKKTNIMITPCICNQISIQWKKAIDWFWVCTPMIQITSILQILMKWPSRQILFLQRFQS